jgi:hypothetical protein
MTTRKIAGILDLDQKVVDNHRKNCSYRAKKNREQGIIPNYPGHLTPVKIEPSGNSELDSLLKIQAVLDALMGTAKSASEVLNIISEQRNTVTAISKIKNEQENRESLKNSAFDGDSAKILQLLADCEISAVWEELCRTNSLPQL